MKSPLNSFDVIIAGGGPAGSAAAIELAQAGASVLLVEQKSFPRHKLCGEFISPECWQHFARLGVADSMKDSGGAHVSETVFYTRKGRGITVPSEWLGPRRALGLSRARMDHNLLERARECGVAVKENAQAQPLFAAEKVVGVSVKSDDCVTEIFSTLTIDATGRTRALARRFDSPQRHRKPQLVAFKAHLKNTRVAKGQCEIYVYPGGYGGLTAIEGGLANLCFIVSAREAKRLASDPERVVRELIMKNSRAAETLATAETASGWLAVALESFGSQSLAPAEGLLTTGDAAAFIDPFTGSGMLMALESGALVADNIVRHSRASFGELTANYKREFQEKFARRLRTSGLLRRVAFVPRLAEAAIFCFSNDGLRRKLSQAIRRGTGVSAGLRQQQDGG